MGDFSCFQYLVLGFELLDFKSLEAQLYNPYFIIILWIFFKCLFDPSFCLSRLFMPCTKGGRLTSHLPKLIACSTVELSLSSLVFWIAHLASLLCMSFLFHIVLILTAYFAFKCCPISPSILSGQYIGAIFTSSFWAC